MRVRNPVMRPKGGWKSVTDVEIAVAEYVDWYNHRCLHGEIGLVPPAELETNHWAAKPTEHYRENPVLIEVGADQPSLYETRGRFMEPPLLNRPPLAGCLHGLQGRNHATLSSSRNRPDPRPPTRAHDRPFRESPPGGMLHLRTPPIDH
jgi:hypothetical protein